jgi:hypothetical protein
MHQGLPSGFCCKGKSYGNVVWQQNWEADDSGLARGSAKEFAIDVNNNRV